MKNLNSKSNDFISKDNIVIGLNASSKEDAITQLAKIMEKNEIVSDAKKFRDDVLERESQTTTGIGNNIAIPHGKSSTVNVASLMFAKTTKPLEWNSLDGSKVSIIFLMAARERDTGKEHLKMLATVAGKLMDDDFVKEIKAENDPDKLVNIFKKIEED